MPKPPSETGFKIDISGLLNSGYHPGLFARNIPLWQDIDGITFTPQGLKRKHGYSLISNLSSNVIRGITTVNEFGTKVAYIGDTDSLWRYKLSDGSVLDVGGTYFLRFDGGATTWDTATTTWDSDTTVWDEAVNEPDIWAFSNFGSWIVATDGIDPIQIKKGHVNFTGMTAGEVTGGVVNNGGSGYAVDDTVTFTGGSGTGFAITITGIDAGGVTDFEVTNFGSGYTNGNLVSQNTTSGTGTGLTINLSVTDCPYTKAHTIAQLGPHILLFNLSTSSGDLPFDFAWCSEDNLDSWIASSTNSAGSLTIREAKTQLRAAVPLGRNIAVYSADQMFLVTYVNAPFYFGYQVALTHGVGAVSKRSVVPVGNLNYGLSKDGFFVTDGVTATDIGADNGINEWLLNNISFSELSKVTAWHNKEEKEVVWNVPLGSTTINTMVYYRYDIQQWGKRTSVLTDGSPSSVFNKPIVGDNAGNIHFDNSGQSIENTYILSRPHDMDDADSVKEITSIRVGKVGNGSPIIELAGIETLDETPVFTETIVVDNTFSEFNVRLSGRYIIMKISGESSADTWEITALEMQGRISGTR